MSMIEEIDAETLKQRLANGENIRLVDVRSLEEFNQGIIAGGEFMPLHTVPLKVNEFSDDVTNIIYCRSGMRATALWALHQAQFGQSVDDILAVAKSAGHDLTALTPRLSAAAL